MGLSTQTPVGRGWINLARSAMELRHFSPRTEEAYVAWIRRFILFHQKRDPTLMGESEIQRFLSYLAQNLNVAASTQNQALNALLFFYRHVLHANIGNLGNIARAHRPIRLPTVFSEAEVRRILAHMIGPERLMASILYGSGLRLLECLRLRVKDLDFDSRQIIVRNGKGEKDRVSVMPASLVGPLLNHLEAIKTLHISDLKNGFGAVSLPHALRRKYPALAKELGWQFIFPSSKRTVEPNSGEECRHHVHESVLQRAVHDAILRAGILKHGSCHTFRHSFAARRCARSKCRSPCR